MRHNNDLELVKELTFEVIKSFKPVPVEPVPKFRGMIWESVESVHRLYEWFTKES